MSLKKKTLGLLLVALLIPSLAWADTMLSWGSSTGEVDGYRLYWGYSPGDYTANRDIGMATQFSISSLPLTEGQTYYFVVRAYNSAGESGDSNIASWTVPDSTPPLPPSGLACQSGGSGLNWEANSENDLKEYRVYYGTSSGSYNPFIPVGNTTSYTVDNLVEGTTYHFVVTAVDNTGNESTYSTEVTSKIADTHSPTISISSPTSNSAYASSEESIVLGGTASDNVGVARVEWSCSTGANGLASGTTNWSVDNIALAAGNNVVTVKAIDAVGNESTDTITVTYIVPTAPDTVNPVAVIGSPTTAGAYATSIDTLNMSGTASDNVGVTQVMWTNSKGGSGTASGTDSWTVSGISLTSGTNVITIIAQDSAGNQGNAVLNVTYTPPDTQAPAIAFVTPTSGSTYATGSATLNMSGTASDNVGVTQISWSNSRGGSDTAIGTGNWSISGISLASGTNQITVSAIDAAGNNGSKTLVVEYTPPDTSSPTAVITSPTREGVFSTSSHTVSLGGTAQDNIGVTSVHWQNSRGGSGIASGTQSWTVSDIQLLEGENVVTVFAEDAAGNQGQSDIQVTYTPPDSESPSVAIDSPASTGSYDTTSSSVALRGSASDNVGVTMVLWRNSKGGSGTASGTTSWAVNDVPLTEGENFITITAQDAMGNAGTKSITVNYSAADTEPPAIQISSPIKGTYYFTRKKTIWLSGTATDASGIEKVTWEGPDGMGGTATGTESWSVEQKIELSFGWNSFTVTAVDGSGNKETVSLYIICWDF